MSNMTVKELLVAAKEIISDKEKWTQGYYAYDKDGEMCEALDNGATCFCSVGALWKAGGVYESQAFNQAEKILNSHSESRYIVTENDSLSHAGVMEIWDKAIEDAEAIEQEKQA